MRAIASIGTVALVVLGTIPLLAQPPLQDPSAQVVREEVVADREQEESVTVQLLCVDDVTGAPLSGVSALQLQEQGESDAHGLLSLRITGSSTGSLRFVREAYADTAMRMERLLRTRERGPVRVPLAPLVTMAFRLVADGVGPPPEIERVGVRVGWGASPASALGAECDDLFVLRRRNGCGRGRPARRRSWTYERGEHIGECTWAIRDIPRGIPLQSLVLTTAGGAIEIELGPQFLAGPRLEERSVRFGATRLMGVAEVDDVRPRGGELEARCGDGTIRTVRLASDGTYVLPGLPPGAAEMVLRASGVERVSRFVVPAAGELRLDWKERKEPGLATVIALDAETEEPLRYVELEVQARRDPLEIDDKFVEQPPIDLGIVTTDGEGRFRWTGAAPPETELRVSYVGDTRTIGAWFEAGTEGQIIYLRRPRPADH